MIAYSRTKEYQKKYKMEYYGPARDVPFDNWKAKHKQEVEEKEQHLRTIFTNGAQREGALDNGCNEGELL